MRRKLPFKGTATALVTPLKKDGSVDEHALRELVDFQLKGKVEAIVPLSITGEGATLSESEQAFVIESVVEQVTGRVPVIGGVSSNSTSKAVSLAKQAKNCGADAIVVLAPWLNTPTQEGIVQHFSVIADAVEMPMVISNAPGLTLSPIEAKTVLRLAEEISYVVGIQEASGNLTQIMEILGERPTGFGVWSGHDSLTLPLVALGADGVISVVSNEVPRMFSELVRAALGGKWEKARELHYKLLPLMNVNGIESNPIPVKAALAIMGMIEESLRLPLTPLSDASRPRLVDVLDDLKLIP